MQIIITKIFCLLLIIVSISCNSSNAAEKTEEIATTTNIKNTSPPSKDTIKTVNLDDILIYGNFDDLKYIFEQKSDTTYVINFWATWCKPCVEELPFFEALHEEFEGEKMRVILVSLDFPNKLKTKLIPFMNEHQMSSEVIVLTDDRYNEWINWVDPDWDGGIPVTMIYNQKNKKFYQGTFANEAELSVLVGEFLRK